MKHKYLITNIKRSEIVLWFIHYMPQCLKRLSYEIDIFANFKQQRTGSRIEEKVYMIYM